ncbi:MAG: ExbD/TolR family protein [Candidatus Zixiibacteriota bacterium]
MKAPKRDKPDVEIPTSSLADIVFLLLIFFLVSTSMNQDKGVGLTLPPPGEQVKLDQDDILPIYVNNQGVIIIRGEKVELNDLQDRVEKELIENEDIVISLRTDIEAKYESMMQVLDVLKQAEAKKISLATPDF